MISNPGQASSSSKAPCPALSSAFLPLDLAWHGLNPRSAPTSPANSPSISAKAHRFFEHSTSPLPSQPLPAKTSLQTTSDMHTPSSSTPSPTAQTLPWHASKTRRNTPPSSFVYPTAGTKRCSTKQWNHNKPASAATQSPQLHQTTASAPLNSWIAPCNPANQPPDNAAPKHSTPPTPPHKSSPNSSTSPSP